MVASLRRLSWIVGKMVGKGKARNLPFPRVLLLLPILALTACDYGGSNSTASVPQTATPVKAHSTTSTPGVLQSGPTALSSASAAVTNASTASPTGLAIQVSPSPGLTSSISAAVTMTEAWGKSLNVNKVPMAIGETDLFAPQVATADGKLLFGSTDPRKFSETGGPKPRKAIFVDVLTHKITEIRQFPHNDTQMGPTSADENWVVWIEAAQEPAYFSDWTMYSYNLKEHTVKQVAKAQRDKNGDVVPTDFVVPVVDHGIVVWGESSPVQGDTTHAYVKSADLATGRIQTLTDTGLHPRISWPNVIWMGPRLENGQSLESATHGALVVLNLQTGERKTLKEPDTPRGFDIHGDSVAWITTEGDAVALGDLSGSHQRVLVKSTSEEDTFSDVLINDRVVSWEFTKNSQVWDRVQERLVTLGDYSSYQVLSGNTLFWIPPSTMPVDPKAPDLQPNDRLIHVLDTSQLPK